MRGRLAERQVALVAVALLAIAISLAITAKRGRSAAASLPPPQGAYTALVAGSGAGAVGTRTACGVVLGPRTAGIASPVLPCGVLLYLATGAATSSHRCSPAGPPHRAARGPSSRSRGHSEATGSACGASSASAGATRERAELGYSAARSARSRAQRRAPCRTNAT